jgi:hypothetical protein
MGPTPTLARTPHFKSSCPQQLPSFGLLTIPLQNVYPSFIALEF